MEILYAGAEMVPFIKVGGLADVAGALTKELARRGHSVRAFLPVYPSVRKHWDRLAPHKVTPLRVHLGGESIGAVLYRAIDREAGVELLLLEQDHFFDRPNPYVDPKTGSDWPDNAERFAFLCHALPAACEAIGWRPEVMHLNDYQLGLVGLLLKEGLAPKALQGVPVVYSIHNLGYQGIFPLEQQVHETPRSVQEKAQGGAADQAARQAGGQAVDPAGCQAVGPAGGQAVGPAGGTAVGPAGGQAVGSGGGQAVDPAGGTAALQQEVPLVRQSAQDRLESLVTALGLPRHLAYPTGPLEFHGKLNFMKAGLVYADLITTVSPTYAREIQTDEHGFGLDGVLRDRAERLVGILNGIDVQVWDPMTDPLIPYNFGPSDFQRKRENKARLLEVTHLSEDLDVPLIGMISRLVDQKGLDLFERIADSFLESHEVRMVVLGSGMLRYERLMRRLAERYPKKLAACVGFDEPLAHLIEAGSDFFLMPSKYEPCGLNQMYSMRYGTVPIVRATGGLADTVEEFQPKAGTGSGF
ncbi:MAG: glycogen synthase, partial [Candidatus Eisenbacteria sp.]|nr:glycogen synthase [Candidatus Eisenbacteria bacterium]